MADIERLMALLDLKKKVQAKKHVSFEHVFHDLLRITGCFQPSQENPQKAKNVGTLSLIIADYDRYAPSRNIYPFLEYLKLLKAGGLPSALPEIEDAVNITTVHQAKGLEFPVVVIGSVMEGRFPTHRRRAAYEIPHELTASRGPEIEDPHVVDERKLFYVAATRARDLLIIGTADVVNKRGGGPSRFIDEMLGTDLTQILERSRSALSRNLKVEAPGKPAAEVRPRLSYSQLSYFLQCPLRYKYLIIDGVQFPYVDVIGYGNNVHRILETIHKKAKNGNIVREEDLPLLVRESWLPTRIIDEERQAQARKAAVEQIGRYLELHAHTLHDVKDAELRFSFDFEGSLVSGRIDLVRRQPSGAVEIVDFKASESRREQYDQTELQLSFYSIGASEDLSLNVGKCTAYFLKDSVNWHFDWNDEKRQVTENVLRSTLDSIRRGDFQPRREYCRCCDEFRNICPHYAR